MRPRGRPPLRWIAASGLVLALAAAGGSDSPVRETGETFRSPERGVVWQAVRDDASGQKWFESERGDRAETLEQIELRELESLPPIERILGRDLAAAATDPGRATETADVTIFFRRQPAHEAGMDARARYAPLFAVPLARSRTIAARAAAERAAEPAGGLGGAIDGEGRALTDSEKAELLAARDEIRTLLDRMRREVADRAKAQAASDQANVAAWLAARSDVTPLGRSWILSTVSARVPLSAVTELVEIFPEIGRISRCLRAQVSLDTSVPTVSASSWWTAGYNGSSSTKVAVLDTGCDSGHPALTVSNAAVFLSSGSTFSDFNDNASSTDDYHSHGTHVSGIVASNDSTYAGVAPGAALMNAKCGYRTTSGGGSLEDADIYSAGDWAGDNGASVMNCSFGGGGTNNGSSGLSQFFDAATFDLSIAVAIASGNSGSSSGSVNLPADAFNVFTVGNFDDAGSTSRSDDSLASSSSRGPTNDGRRKPEVSAPGTNINSCSSSWEGSGGDFVSYTGTSMASPHVAGALALLLDYGTSWAPEALKALLVTTATNTSPAPVSPDDNWGYGGLDLAAAYSCRASVAESTLTSSGSRYVLVRTGTIASGGRVSIAWNRHTISNNSSAPATRYALLDLDLAVYDGSSGASLGTSTSSVNTVEQVKLSAAAYAAIVKVKRPGNWPSGFTTEYFAVAAESSGTSSVVAAPALAASFATSPPSAVGPSAVFDVAVSVTNSGGVTAFAPTVTLGLPSGYSVQGGATQTLADVAAGASATATFAVTSASSGTTGTRSITASGTSSSYGETISTSTLTASQLLDVSAPAGSVSVNSGATFTGSSAVTLTLTSSDAGSGLNGMRLRNAGGTWTNWETVAASRSWTLTAEGLDTVEVEFRDVVGNVTQVSDAITFDATAPTGSVTLGDGSGYTAATVVPFVLTATDAVSGVVDQRVSTDGTTFGAWQSYGTAQPDVSLGSTEGVTTRWAQFRDTAGNTSAPIAGSVTRDLTAPTGSVVIAGGAAVTNQPIATVDLSATDALSGVGDMQLSFDGVSWFPWTPFVAQIDVNLRFPDSVNTLYVRYRDRAGNASSAYSDSIVVDATGPAGTLAIDGGASFTASGAVTLAFSATDATSGVASMRLRNDDDAWGAWQVYATSAAWTLVVGEGARSVHAQFRDGSGNVSAEVEATITIDVTPPSGSLSVLAGAAAVNHADVTLDLDATDAASGWSDLRLRNEGSAWSAWLPAAASLPFDLAPGEGVRRVGAQFRDAVGNVSAETFDDILVDVTAPHGSLALSGGRPLVLPWEDLVAEPVSSDGPAGSGVATVEFSEDGGATWGGPLADAASFVVDRPTGVVDAPVSFVARWRDAAGNLSEAATATAYLVAEPMQGLDFSKTLDGRVAQGADVDAYTVQLLAGDVLGIRTTARAAKRGGRFAIEIDLYDPSGARVVDGRWPAGARKPGVAKYVAAETGSFTVLVRASGDDADLGGTYRLATRVTRPRALSRLAGTAELVPSGGSSTATIEFDGPDGAYVEGWLKLVVPTSFQLIAPDGSVEAFVLRPGRGATKLLRHALAGGTGRYRLTCATYGSISYSLTIAPAPRSGRATEDVSAGRR